MPIQASNDPFDRADDPKTFGDAQDDIDDDLSRAGTGASSKAFTTIGGEDAEELDDLDSAGKGAGGLDFDDLDPGTDTATDPLNDPVDDDLGSKIGLEFDDDEQALPDSKTFGDDDVDDNDIGDAKDDFDIDL